MTGAAGALEGRIRRPYNHRASRADRSRLLAASPATTYAVTHVRLKCLIEEAERRAPMLDGEPGTYLKQRAHIVDKHETR